MADDDIDRISEAFTEFCLSTKLSRSRVTEFDVRAYLRCIQLTAVKYDNVECDSIPLITGSIAEFSIEPMLPCFSDVDVMYHHSNQLAIPSGYTPPTQLPGEFGSHVEGYEIIENEFSGYVYLERCCLLSECVDEYNVVQCERLLATNGSSDADDSRHGPALVNEHYMLSFAVGTSAFGICRDDRTHSVDSVYCMRCLWWPPQAADWPTRHRSHGWPDSATINRVVSNGCDVVGVAHPLCRHDEWMRKHQWRLSFSRAEIELLNTWTPVQQIVYHMLRYFMKTERLTDSAADKSKVAILSNYHIKTLVLWACELKSTSWWTDDLNLVRICVELLHTLVDWLTSAHYQHYFINNCNFLDQLGDIHYTQVIANRLIEISREWFCEWCIDNYIQKCAQLCPSNISNLLRDRSSKSPSFRMPHYGLHPVVCLQETVSAIVKWRLDISVTLILCHLYQVQCGAIKGLSKWSMTLRLCQCMTHLTKAGHSLLNLYCTAFTFLHVAYKTTQDSLKDEMLDVLATTCLQTNHVRHCLNARHSGVLSLNQAAILIKVVANNLDSTVQLILTELSKAYLHRALKCKDSQSNSVYCLSNVYLAVLYFTTGQYQTAIDHCALVMRLQDHRKCNSYAVQGELLPKIDDEVDGILGLAVFYHYIRAAVLNEDGERENVSVFTTELFAHYLHIKFLSVTKCHQLPQSSLADEIQQYRNRFGNCSQIFITDVMVFSFLFRTKYPQNSCLVNAVGGKSKLLTLFQFDTSKLVQLLQQSAVEYLTTCRKFELRDFDHLVTADFKALYAYKCGQYRHCLQLSVHNVRRLLADKYQFMLFVSPFPEFIQLMDDDLVSLIGLRILCNSDSCFLVISHLVLSLYLIVQCQIKLRHPMTSLSRTFHYVQLARFSSGILFTCVVHQCGQYFQIFDRVERDVKSIAFDEHVLKFVEQKILSYMPVSS